MEQLVLLLVIGGAAGTFGLWLGMRLARRAGLKTDKPPAQRARVFVTIAATLGIGLFCAWAIANGHAAVGIGLLVALYVLPSLVLIPVRIRQSNRRTREARARREGSSLR
jgi:hypothetical protein